MPEYPSPVAFGEPTPEGRTAGDCEYCCDCPAACDCQLRYTTTPGHVVTWEVRSALAVLGSAVPGADE